MKKILNLILSILLSIILCFCLCSCSTEQQIENRFGDKFGLVEELTDSITIVYDKETKVQYLFYLYGYRSGITVLLDSDGKPLLYKEE